VREIVEKKLLESCMLASTVDREFHAKHIALEGFSNCREEIAAVIINSSVDYDSGWSTEYLHLHKSTPEALVP
jgi:hypothetical protein